jgi:hypothetical protein
MMSVLLVACVVYAGLGHAALDPSDLEATLKFRLSRDFRDPFAYCRASCVHGKTLKHMSLQLTRQPL